MAQELYPRLIRPLVVEALRDTRVVLVMGARQVGKSTLTEAIAADEHPMEVFTLDDKTTRDAATADPNGFVAALGGTPALIDEVQRAPDLLLAIKEAVDIDQRPGRFLLTGSANILTAPRVADALTGRVEFVQLWPLAQAEIERTATNFVDALFEGRPPAIGDAPVGREAFVDRVARGGYPEARLRDGRRRDRWFANYLATTFGRDLRDVAEVQKAEEMPKLLRLIAARAGGLFTARSLAARMGIDHKTVASYTRLLETLFLVQRFPGWRPGIGSREVQASKAYVADSGLHAHLLGADEARIAGDDQVTGKMLENFVAFEVLKQASWASVDTRQYHYRDGRDEVDIVLETRSGSLAAIELKASATVTRRDVRALEELRLHKGRSFVCGAVVYAGRQTLPLGDRLWAVPVTGLWTP